MRKTRIFRAVVALAGALGGAVARAAEMPELVLDDGSFRDYADDAGERFSAFLPKIFTESREKQIFGRTGVFNGYSLFQRRFRRETYKEAFLELAQWREARRLESAHDLLATLENVPGAGVDAADKMLTAYEMLGYLDLRYVKDTGYVTRALKHMKGAGRVSRELKKGGNLDQLNVALQGVSSALLAGDIVIEALAMTAIGRDAGLQRLMEVRAALDRSGATLDDPALREGLEDAISELTPHQTFWTEMERAFSAHRREIIQNGFSWSLLLLGKTVGPAVVAATGLTVSVWALPVSLAVLEIKTLIDMERHHERAVCLASIARALDDLAGAGGFDPGERAALRLEAAYLYNDHHHEAMSNWLVKAAGVLWKDIKEGRDYYRERVDRAAALLDARGPMPAAAASVPRSSELVLVLDTSGSMKGGALDAARAAAKDVVRTLADRDRLAYVPFSGGAATALPLTAMDPAGRDAAARAIEAAHSGGGTNYKAALQEALGALGAAPAGTAILFLSDGLPNQEDYWDEVAQCAARGWRIFTVGFQSGQTNFDPLRKMAAQTGGTFSEAHAFNLSQVFGMGIGSARGLTPLKVHRDVLRKTGDVHHVGQALAAGATTLLAQLVFAGSDVTLTAVSPAGKAYAGSDAADGVEFFQDDQTHLRQYRITAPAAGQWTFRPFGKDIPPQGELYTLTLLADLPATLTPWVEKAFYQPGEAVPLRLMARDLAPGAAVTARVLAPGRAPSAPIPLADDGDPAKGDLQAGDGVFSGLAPSAEAIGLHAAEFQVAGASTGNAPVAVTLHLAYQVGDVAEVLAWAQTSPAALNYDLFVVPISAGGGGWAGGDDRDAESSPAVPSWALALLGAALAVFVVALVVAGRRRRGGAGVRAPGVAGGLPVSAPGAAPVPGVAGGLPVSAPGVAPDRVALRIGRAPTNDLVLDVPGVSRFHAELFRDGDQWVLRDLGSENGTLVNGRPVRLTKVRLDDTVTIGNVQTTVAELLKLRS